MQTAPTDWPGTQVKLIPVANLVPYARNAKMHPEAQVGQIALLPVAAPDVVVPFPRHLLPGLRIAEIAPHEVPEPVANVNGIFQPFTGPGCRQLDDFRPGVAIG